MITKRLMTHYAIGLLVTTLLCGACQDPIGLPTQPAAVKVWDKTFGGSKNDYSHSVAGTSDGGFLIGGTSASNISDGKSQNCARESDYWIIKIK